MEIKLSVKQPGRADVNIEFSCNAEEAAVLINDPVYQELGKKLCSEISFKPKQQSQNYHDRVKDVERNLSRTLDKVVKNRDITQLDVMKHTIKVLEDRIASLKKHNSDF